MVISSLKSYRRSLKEKRQARSVAGCKVQCRRDAVQGGRSRVRCRLRLHAPGPPHALPLAPHVSPPTDLACFDVRCPPATMQNLCPLTAAMGRWEFFNLCPFCKLRIRVRSNHFEPTLPDTYYFNNVTYIELCIYYMKRILKLWFLFLSW